MRIRSIQAQLNDNPLDAHYSKAEQILTKYNH